MKQYTITRRQKNSKSCFICGLSNEYGLKARFYETTDKEIIAVFSTKDEHQSYPERLHGGVIAAIMDEAIGRAIFCYSESGDEIWGVTTELKMEYKRPVPLECQLYVVGRITRNDSRVFEAEGELYLPDGRVAAKAYGKYLKQTIGTISGGSTDDFMEFGWGVALDEPVPQTITI